jgi:hypothetical protein
MDNINLNLRETEKGYEMWMMEIAQSLVPRQDLVLAMLNPKVSSPESWLVSQLQSYLMESKLNEKLMV